MLHQKGNIVSYALSDKFDVIIHGCNCFCKMGSGVALALRSEFPGIYDADCQTRRGDKDKLGTYTFYRTPLAIVIINAYTQWGYGTGRVHADYNAISQVFKKIKENYSGKSIAYPKIGAGLGGGDWRIISSIIDIELEDENHTLITL